MKKAMLSLSLLSLGLFAADISVEDVFVKQTPPNAKNSAIFLTLKNNSDKDIALVSAKSNLSDKVELHTHTNQDGKMSMIKVDKIDIKAHSNTALRPGSYHIMLLDIKNPVDANTRADLTLVFDNKESIELKNISSKELKKPNHPKPKGDNTTNDKK
ncbi:MULTISPECIES: copper chaperone PCu(A)C [unclassified Campylobacter]|uniref:copper chaperone PCu(A)C n=1 Tax=unclassified Campylobacter TaxID=2593542 RepID=UPI001237C238|nr:MULTISPECIES: copper chaperone PCu(A)C [unclassified Campylobacter]KAA6224733.1 copper chaperone PCu(A)C [Campylobacter sp. LR185c]KAA6225730.1 copper chaperone PCu(A)C [Campylobacter sp. LR286c]KAA6225851.1 copper chaperone PCu(A)C [Campylobacter sp. LR196d]KAA6229703.1 copper chaperone PCu(A)C [Campylobacter sp. LR291e]KAA6230051.1 copper chaperone PCu(A)C [Campylobacter sp. LR264d]